MQALADFEGRTDTPVTLETDQAGRLQARWDDAGLPQSKTYDPEDRAKLIAYPALPEVMSPVQPGFVQALADACKSAAQLDTGYFLSNIQLQGSQGVIVATDGRQLLVQTGWPLPWSEEVLVPASSVFACKEFSQDGAVSIAKTDTHVTLRIGNWMLHLPITKSGRFPPVEKIIPRREGASLCCHLDHDDCTFLARSLSRLPGAQEEFAPLTLDLNGQVCIRARDPDQEHAVELVLARSTATGAPLRLAMERTLFARAIHLGLTELVLNGAETPVLFHDEKRKFVARSLSKALSLAPSKDAVCILSTTAASGRQITSPRSETIVNEPHINDSPSTNVNGQSSAESTAAVIVPSRKGTRPRKAKSTGLSALIEEAEALKDALRDIYGKAQSLVLTLKRQRKQTRLVQTSLQALRELQSVE